MKENLAKSKNIKPQSKASIARAKRGYEYLTTRLFIRAAKKASDEAADKAMETMGYVVIGLDGWVVKKYKDGRIERLEEL